MAAIGSVQEFSDALPGLRAARDSGHLVPFVGAGVSRPYCRTWPQFVGGLFESFGEGQPEGLSSGDTERLYREADRVAAWMRLLPARERQAKLQAALHDPAVAELPRQALALAAFPWRLVITTNYDDVLARSRAVENVVPPRILGRSAPDSVLVVRSLDSLAEPIIWHVQGALDSDDEGPERTFDRPGSQSLLDELVVGHQQYQRAIHASPTFRRAFSEVFRRRSLLFIGSGLAESYFVNLISETLLSLGPSSQPHFALFSRSDLQRVDADFLAVRLGITPICYGDSHDELPSILSVLCAKGASGYRHQTGPRSTAASFSILRAHDDAADLTVTLREGLLARPPAGECVILSVGRDGCPGNFRPGLGSQASTFLEGLDVRGCCAPFSFADVDGVRQGRMFRVGLDGTDIPVFMLAARELDAGDDDASRSLASIVEATEECLAIAERDGFTVVHMGLLAAGPSRTDEASYCLIAQLCGIGAFAARVPAAKRRIQEVKIHIAEQSVWSSFCEGRIPVLDILSSRLARVLVRWADATGAIEEFALSVPRDATIGDVLAAYRIQDENINIRARPLPRLNLGSLREVRVFPGMVIDVWPKAFD